MKKYASVKAYLADVPPEQRGELDRLRQAISSAAPAATEGISYQMPAFKENGRAIVCYAAFRDHCSLFPMSMSVFEEYGDELEPFRTGKGTLRTTAEHKLPASIIKKIVKARRAENAARIQRAVRKPKK
jgi:uncharacterized protein YdhG (YjbR/CyaY superfamily)